MFELVELFVHPAASPTGDTAELNPLLRAAMYGDTEVARTISRRRPELLLTRTANGESADALALAAGHVGTAVALLRAQSVSPADPADLLERLMAELSEELVCAVWLHNLEHLLWHYSNSPEMLPPTKDFPRFSDLHREVRQDLIWLSHACGGWVRFGSNGREFITDADWRREHERWQRG